MFPGATSTQLLNTLRDGDSTSLSHPLQCLTTLSMKKCFLVSNLNLPCHLLPAIGGCSHHTTTFFQVVTEANKISPELPFLQAKQPSGAPDPSPASLNHEKHESLTKNLCFFLAWVMSFFLTCLPHEMQFSI